MPVSRILFLCTVLLASSHPSALAQTYSFTTIAGVAASDGYADGTGSAARFNRPENVATDSSGNIFVADYQNSVIRKISPAGAVTTFAGQARAYSFADGRGSNARFRGPHGIAIDSQDNLFVSDSENHVIRKISPDGLVTTVAGRVGTSGSTDGPGAIARFNGPRGVAVDGAGVVYVAEPGNSVIRKITPDGNVTTLAGLAGSSGTADGVGNAARFDSPDGVAVDTTGNVYVADTFNSTIRRISAAGVVTTLAGHRPAGFGFPPSADGIGGNATFSFPGGVAVDASGQVFVADGKCVRRITPDGVVSTIAGSFTLSGSTDGAGLTARFGSATGLTVNRAGEIMVADAGNHTIRKISAAGVVSTVAGLGGVERASVDGTGSSVRFNQPYALAADVDNLLYVLEPFNGTIRSATATGTVATLRLPDLQLDRAFGVTVDRAGNFYVADTYNSVVRKITRSGTASILAGLVHTPGAVDGSGADARFNQPFGIAVDRAGVVYVSDNANHTIHKIQPSGAATTLAGFAGSAGAADSTGSAARFFEPRGLALDAAGNLFVADFRNSTIRKISPAGEVTTFAGLAGSFGGVDGAGNAARFGYPTGLASDSGGNLYVSDRGNNTLRHITPAGFVTTIGGLAGTVGSADGTGNDARFYFPEGISVDSAGDVYVLDSGNNTLRKGARIADPFTIVTGPVSHQLLLGAGVALTVSATGSDLTYQWKKNGETIVGATNSSYDIVNANPASTGLYSVVVSAGGLSRESAPATVAVAPLTGPSRLINLSTRGFILPGGDITVGFVIRGSGEKSMLIRGVGPMLSAFGIAGALTDPRLEVIPSGSRIATHSNDDWGGDPRLAAAFAGTGAFPVGPKEAAVLAAIGAGSYSARITSAVPAGSGIALAEVYDFDGASPAAQIVNLSTLAFVGTGAQALVPGFVIGGTTPKQLLIRAVGPGLVRFGVSNVLLDPQLAVIPLGGVPIASNDNWESSSAVASAFALIPGSKDAAVVVRLPPGGYTVVVTGTGNTTGTALVEIYDLDP